SKKLKLDNKDIYILVVHDIGEKTRIYKCLKPNKNTIKILDTLSQILKDNNDFYEKMKKSFKDLKKDYEFKQINSIKEHFLEMFECLLVEKLEELKLIEKHIFTLEEKGYGKRDYDSDYINYWEQMESTPS